MTKVKETVISYMTMRIWRVTAKRERICLRIEFIPVFDTNSVNYSRLSIKTKNKFNSKAYFLTCEIEINKNRRLTMERKITEASSLEVLKDGC
jgi:hypothetical protein